MSRLDEVQFANEQPIIRGVNDRVYKKADVRTASFSRIFNRLLNENIIEMTHTLAECADAMDGCETSAPEGVDRVVIRRRNT